MHISLLPANETMFACRSSVRKFRDDCVHGVLFVAAAISILTTIAIAIVLLTESIPFFQHVHVWEFVSGTRWAPLFEPRSFGLLPLIAGTFLITGIASLVAIPAGLAVALFLSEYASQRTRSFVKPALEILAGVPTVVYGYFALSTVTPVLRVLIPQTEVFNAASAGIVVGIMILPIIASQCDDAFASVPDSIRAAGLAVGATKLEVSTGLVLPAAMSGVIASFVLALSRAIGETMAVALAAGATPKLTLNPLESVQTMTAFIVQISLGDSPAGTVEYQSIFAVGLVLFLVTLLMNLIAQYVLRRSWEKYE